MNEGYHNRIDQLPSGNLIMLNGSDNPDLIPKQWNLGYCYRHLEASLRAPAPYYADEDNYPSHWGLGFMGFGFF